MDGWIKAFERNFRGCLLLTHSFFYSIPDHFQALFNEQAKFPYFLFTTNYAVSRYDLLDIHCFNLLQ